jgi:MFS family permease
MFRAAFVVLAMAFVVLLFNSGGRFLMGLTLVPMATEFGWSRTAVSSAVTVFMIISAASLPFVGQIVDRFGAMRVIAVGVVISGLSVAAMAFIETPLQVLLLYGMLFALGSAATSVTPIGVLVSQWFPNRVGMANSVAIAGMGAGQLLIISVLSAQFQVLGWRGSYGAVGVATLLCVLPLIWFTSRMMPCGVTVKRGTTDDTGERLAETEKFSTIRQAMTSWRFNVVLVVYVICGFQDFMIATHIVAFALDEGIDGKLAGDMLAVMGLTGLIGVLFSGWLNDRCGSATPTAINFVIRISTFAIVLLSQETFAIVTAALLYGLTFWMTAPLVVVFARLFCRFALLGAVSGLITMVHHFAGGIGALFGARVFDVSGSYDGAMWVMLVFSLLGLSLCPLLGRRA